MSSTRENAEVQNAQTIAAESTSNKPPRSRPNAKSAVWQHFEKIYNRKTNKIEGTKCMYCEKTFAYSVANGTSSMRKHLTSCKKFPQNVDSSQTLLSFKTTRKDGRQTSEIGTWRFDQEECRKLLAEVIISTEDCFKKVEHPKFRQFLSALQPL